MAKSKLRQRKQQSNQTRVVDKSTQQGQEETTPSPTQWWQKWVVPLVFFTCLLGASVYSNGLDRDLKQQASIKSVLNPTVAAPKPLAVYKDFAVMEILPHDSSAFTQGLTSFDGKLWEGTGLNGQSELRRIDTTTGETLQSHALHADFFGEGICHFTTHDGESRLIQLDWTRQTGWIYNADTLQEISEFSFSTLTKQGWGITYNDVKREFIVSDGSSTLHVWDRDTLQEKRRFKVQWHRQDVVHDVRHLNELEFTAHGSILANVWYQDVLVEIDPESGLVQRVYDFTALYDKKDRPPTADCFNGIAITDVPDEYYVTGKNWPHMYRVKLQNLQ